MLKCFQKSASILLVSGLLFVPHIGKCVSPQPGNYATTDLSSDAIPRASFTIYKNGHLKGQFHKQGKQVPFEGEVDRQSGKINVHHKCQGTCPEGVASESTLEFGESSGTLTSIKVIWKDPKTKKETSSEDQVTYSRNTW